MNKEDEVKKEETKEEERLEIKIVENCKSQEKLGKN
jgi:hypothetical protein